MVYRPQSDEYETFDDGSISLAPYESCFVLMGNDNSLLRANQQFTPSKPAVCSEQTISTNDWNISFRESSITLKQQQLFDWSQSDDDRIRYFSGHARYTTTFKQQKKPAGRVWLSLPNVKDIAHVWVNGQDCGLAWTAPYEVDITQALKTGQNTLEIEVVNTWHNALRGADKGKAPYNGIWTNARYRSKGDGLLPAGLLAQPRLKTEQ